MQAIRTAQWTINYKLFVTNQLSEVDTVSRDRELSQCDVPFAKKQKRFITGHERVHCSVLNTKVFYAGLHQEITDVTSVTKMTSVN